MRRRSRARWAAPVLLAAVVTAGSATPAVAAEPDQGPRSYVALGDSYAAGPLIPIQTGEPVGCLRSTSNYPSVVAETLDIPDFRDVSCSAATTEHITGPQNVPLGVNPPQLDALGPDTELVTVSIGGNDIGFGDIISECARRSPLQPTGSACADFYTSGGTDELAQRIDEAAPQVAAVLDAITERSPDARVLLVGYPAILPDEGPGCYPVVPFSPGDVAYLRGVEKALNAMLSDEASGAGVDFVDTYTPSIGHDVCQLPGTKWIEGLVPTAPAAPVHPNALGMAGIGAVVAESVTDTAVLAG
ncbi:SGNH/GDSL hydrolase family protein [Pseudonocardia kunmingensis]|uniref:GDSL-like lipase/acylhydrolase family protein n=1 Tax=Pseudonocardia kunmingensis TaxID=630975 RepID=A0A543D3L4_9PSEU|nr:SGNH/GDSL hydrolase family protein [Pseudonocardia kunmingensis]TQM03925.1 GDSL-like lipase/acylhydrolase family protein [Pseudonocardia kunmingensis]